MNRCITCSKKVTKPTTENVLNHEDRQYLVCCSLCEREFIRKPEYYLAVLRSVFGDSGTKVNSQSSSEVYTDCDSSNLPPDSIRMLRKLKDGFAEIERSNAELNRHFDQISESGGLKGLRFALRDHREMMDLLVDKMAVHTGVCRFVVAMAESSMTAPSR